MPIIQIVENANCIPVCEGWADIPEFKSKGRIVDREGNTATFPSPLYRIIAKKVRVLSPEEKAGFFLVKLCSENLARAFLAKGKAHIHYAVFADLPRLPAPQIFQTVYFYPVVPFRGIKLQSGEMLNFVRVDKGNKPELVAVTSCDEYKTCMPYSGSALEAFFELIQDPDSLLPQGQSFMQGKLLIKLFLEHPANSVISAEDFFTFIVGKDTNGVPRICTLNVETTREVLTTAKEKGITLNLKEKTPTGETLFSRWIKEEAFFILKLIVEVDPSTIEQAQEFFYELVVGGNDYLNASDPRWLLEKAIDHPSSKEEITWIQKVLKNNLSIQEFLTLDPDLKKKLYFFVNAKRDIASVQELKKFGMETEPHFVPGPSRIVAPNMDIVSAGIALLNFLCDVRNERILIKENEFAQGDGTKYEKRDGSFPEIQYGMYIEKIIKELGLKHIKVLKKRIVVPDEAAFIRLKVADDGKIEQCDPMNIRCSLYVEHIAPVDRKLTLEEAKELMIILVKASFDQDQKSIVIAEQGIYFRDTEFDFFSPSSPSWVGIGSIMNLLDPKDQEEFVRAFEEQRPLFEQEKKPEVQEDKYSQLLNGYAGQIFKFFLADMGF